MSNVILDDVSGKTFEFDDTVPVSKIKTSLSDFNNGTITDPTKSFIGGIEANLKSATGVDITQSINAVKSAWSGAQTGLASMIAPAYNFVNKIPFIGEGAEYDQPSVAEQTAARKSSPFGYIAGNVGGVIGGAGGIGAVFGPAIAALGEVPELASIGAKLTEIIKAGGIAGKATEMGIGAAEQAAQFGAINASSSVNQQEQTYGDIDWHEVGKEALGGIEMGAAAGAVTKMFGKSLEDIIKQSSTPEMAVKAYTEQVAKNFLTQAGIGYAMTRAGGGTHEEGVFTGVLFGGMGLLHTHGEYQSVRDGVITDLYTAYGNLFKAEFPQAAEGVPEQYVHEAIRTKAQKILAKDQAKADELTAKVQAEAELPKDLQPAPSTGIEVNVPTDAKPAEPSTGISVNVTPEMKAEETKPSGKVPVETYSNANEAMRELSDDRSHGDEGLSDAANVAWKKIFKGSEFGEAPPMDAKAKYEEFINEVNAEYARQSEPAPVEQFPAEQIVASSPEMTTDLIKDVVKEVNGVKEEKTAEPSTEEPPRSKEYEKKLEERRSGYAEAAKGATTEKLTSTLKQIGEPPSWPSDGIDLMRKQAIEAELARRGEKPAVNKIADFGEKQPGHVVMQDAKSGKWFVYKLVAGGKLGEVRKVGKGFETEQAANEAVPLKPKDIPKPAETGPLAYKTAEEYIASNRQLYHQTTEEGLKGIRESGLKVMRGESAVGDELPVGINIKTSPDLIRLKGKEQLGVYLPKDAKIKEFASRDAVVGYLRNASDEYNKMIFEKKALDVEQGRALDKLEKEELEIRKDTNISDADKKVKLDEINKAQDDLLASWKKEADARGDEASKLASKILLDEGLDAIYIKEDVGGVFGNQKTDNTIVLKEGVAKTRSQLKSEFDAAQKPAESKGGEVKEANKDLIWQNTQQEFIDKAIERNPLDVVNKQYLKEQHKLRVEKAIKDGKPVPPEVLAEYPELKPTFGSENTVFTKEMKDAAEKSFREKTGGLHANIDPTAMGDLIKIGGYYVEGGIRDFKAFSEKMIEDFGETIKPYIQNIWDKANEGMEKAKQAEEPQQETGKTQMENEGKPEEKSTKAQEEISTSKKPSNPMSGFSDSSEVLYQDKKENENKYVKDEPLNLFVKENKKGKVDLKGTANDVRQKLVSYMDTQIVRMNQQVDAWKRAVKSPTERAGAFFLAAGAEGDVAKVQDFIDYLKSNPEGVRPEYAAELIPKLEAALKLSPEARKMIEEGSQYYDEAGKVAKELGTIRTIRENYQSLRLYKPEAEGELTKTELTQGIKRSTAHSKQRVYDNVFDAIKDGKELASDDYASLAGIHNEELTYVNAGRRLTNEMSDADTGLGKWVRSGNEPEGWEQVGRLQKDVPIKDKNGEPVLGDDGNQLHSHSVFVAPKEVAKGLEAVSDPNFLRKVKELNGLEKFNGFIKSFNVALSFFHHFQFVKQTLSSYHGEKILSELPQMIDKMQTPEFKDNELYFTKMGGRTTMRDANMDILSDLKTVKGTLIDKVSGLPVAKQLLQLTDASNHLLFDYMQRFMKVSTFSERVADWMARNPDATNDQILEAHKGFAKAINTTFGGLNWESLGINKTSRSVLRLGLFAPDWLMSSILHTKYAFSDAGTAGAVARANLVKGLLVGTAFTQGLNMLTNGHTTDKNKRGHQMEWQVAPGVYVNFYGGATGELVKFISNVVETGGIQGAIRYFANKGSPLVRLGAMAATGVNYAGRNIWAGKDALEKNIDGLLNLSGTVAPVPFAAQASSLDYVKQPDKTIAGTIAVATGLGRYSKGQEQNWHTSKSKELLQFKSKVGDDKFTEANDTFNKRLNDRMDVLTDSDKYNALSDDDKKRMLTEEKNKIKEKVFHEYNFRYHPERKDKLPKI